ncbi:glycerol kinase GlpK [Nitrogeniibacter aestuarii]|uniref:glycerol kinase GlpK n=1 Tax=Nitrogeniibacter aestuarii TaxID=2815343 RepID=UPI001D0F719B|nr:glycerol kinase GlpK [Nitrogeniibacter aestuarii]
MNYVLALDQGTTSSRAMLFDETARVIATAQQEFPQIFPRPGWVEHDAEEIWRTQIACARQVINESGVPVANVRALGITNQRETTVLWDRKTGVPLANAIVWQDRRTADKCDAIRAQGHAERIRKSTGLELDAYFSATKLAWLLDHVEGARARAARGELAFGTIDSWLIWHLSGGACHVTDISNAARTMLFDIHRGEWDAELLALFDIPVAVLPDVVDSSAVVGETDATLFGEPIAIAGIAGDQQAATFGQACLKPGMAKNTYGTGCFLTVHTGGAPVPSQHRLLSTVAWRRNGQTDYLLEGSIFTAGALIQWLRDGLGIIRSAPEVEALAAQVPDSGEVVMVPAFAGMGAPHWDAYARGTLIGLTRGSTAAHIARASLEAVALQTADLLTAIAADGAPVKELRVDGGMTRNDLLMQLQADVAGVPVVRPEMTETTVLGAAFLAGRAVGVWPDDQALIEHWSADRVFEPQASADWREAMRARWSKAVERARGWADGA